MRTRIRKDSNLAPAGGFSSSDLDLINAVEDGVYSVSMPVPGTSQAVTLEAPWSSINIDITAGKGLASVQLVADTERKILNAPVNLLVVYGQELATGGDAPTIVGPDITSGQVAQALAAQAGATLEWDQALDYPVVALLHPTESYAGTLRQCLDKLLAPFNRGPERLAHVSVAGGVVSCRLQDHTSQAYEVADVDLGDGHWVEELSIQRMTRAKSLGNIGRILFLYHQPKTIQQQTLTSREDKKDGDGNVVERRVVTTTVWGGFTVQEVEETYKRGVVWVDELQTQAEWRLILASRKTTSYEYEPALADPNIYYVRSRKLLKKTETIESYSNGELTETKTITTAYEYDDDGYLLSETITESVLFTDAPEQSVVKATVTTYERLSPDMYRVNTSVESHKIIYVLQQPGQLPPPYSNPDNDWIKVEDFTVEAQEAERVIAGQAPYLPTLPPVFGQDRVKTTTYELKLQDTGSTVTVETYFDPTGLFNIYKRNFQDAASRWVVRLTGRSMYDLEPLTWIRLTCSKTVKIKAITPTESKEFLLSDLLGVLPPLLVRSVEVSREGASQVTTVEAVGWS